MASAFLLLLIVMSGSAIRDVLPIDLFHFELTASGKQEKLSKSKVSAHMINGSGEVEATPVFQSSLLDSSPKLHRTRIQEAAALDPPAPSLPKSVAQDIPVYYKSALYGFVSSVALPIGALCGILLHPVRPKRTAYVVAFGAGALIFAVSTEMYAEALHQVEVDGTGFAHVEITVSMSCAVIGAVLFTWLNIKLEGWSTQPTEGPNPEEKREKVVQEEDPKSFRVPAAENGSSNHAALAMWLGVGLDGIPESILIGFITNEIMMTAAFLVSIFVANFPEAFSSSSMLKSKGWPAWKVLCLWGSLCLSTTILSGLSSYVLFVLMHGPGAEMAFKLVGSAVEGLAGGAMLAMVASTMLPEAYHQGGVWVGVVTVLGFLASCTVKVFFGAAPGNENAHAL